MGMATNAQTGPCTIRGEETEQTEVLRPVGAPIHVCVERNAKSTSATVDPLVPEGDRPWADLAYSALPRAAKGQNSQRPATEDTRPLEEDDGNQGSQLAAKGCRTQKDVSVDDLLDLLKRQNHRCALSGRVLTPEDCMIDHIEPFSLCIANHVLGNLQLVVREANKAKGVLSMPAFVSLCCDVADCQRGRGGYPLPGQKDTPSL